MKLTLEFPPKLTDTGVLIIATLLFIGVSLFITRPTQFSQATAAQPAQSAQPTVAGEADEIRQIKLGKNVGERSVIYRRLIDRVGPEQAQELLYRSGMPFDGETHLLNHTSGDWLYEKYGNQGITRCKDYFLSSCYHGLILHAMAEQDQQAAIKEIMEACWKTGVTTVTQCAHGMGHGFLVYYGYANIPQAIAKCDEVNTYLERFPLFNCHDGAFMENVWAVHNGEPAPDRWVKEDSATFPCDDPRIGEQYRGACWSNQPSLLFMRFQGSVEEVAKVCSSITNEQFKGICHNGLARQIHPMTGGSSEKVMSYCNRIPEQNWRDKCISDIAVSAYSVGDRTNPYTICTNVEDRIKQDCFNNVFGVMHAYGARSEEANRLCSQITLPLYREQCVKYQWN